MAELEIDMNVAYEFSAMTEAGAQLVALSGPGHVGLVNLGNSCYMNSVLQVGVQTAAPPTLPPCTLVCVGGRGSVGVGGGEWVLINVEKRGRLQSRPAHVFVLKGGCGCCMNSVLQVG